MSSAELKLHDLYNSLECTGYENLIIEINQYINCTNSFDWYYYLKYCECCEIFIPLLSENTVVSRFIISFYILMIDVLHGACSKFVQLKTLLIYKYTSGWSILNFNFLFRSGT